MQPESKTSADLIERYEKNFGAAGRRRGMIIMGVAVITILAVVIGFAPAWLWPVLVRLTANGDSQAADGLQASILRFSLPGVGIAGLLGFGLVGMSDDVYKMSQAWIIVAIILWLALLAVYFFVARPAITAFRNGDTAAKGKLAMATGVSHLVLLVMLGGAWMPSFLFPAWLQQATLFVPTRWAVDGLQTMSWRGLGLASALPSVAALLGFAALFGSIAALRFRWE